MKIREVFEYVDEIMENVFSEKVKLRWLNQIEAELQTDVLLLAADGVVQYTLADMEAELIAPPPYDELYTEYLQYRICLAQEEPERANNKATTFNRIYTAYQIHVAQTANPGNGMAERMQYYLTAYQLAVKHGETKTEQEWLDGLHGRNGKDGTGVTMEFNEETGMLEITVTESSDSAGGMEGPDGNVFLLDTTLTMEGAAADAKAAGDAIRELMRLVDDFINGSGGTVAVGVKSVVQTKSSTEDNGINEWTMTLTNGKTAVLQVRNGSCGNDGVGVSAIGYNADTRKWYWVDDLFFNRTNFDGPDIYTREELDRKFEVLMALIGAGNDQNVCVHSRTEEVVTFQGSDGVNGTHRRRVLCKDCGATISDTTEACSRTHYDNYRCEEGDTSHSFQIFCPVCKGLLSTDEWGAHIDEDGDGLCDLCGSCAHDYKRTYTSNGDGTHTQKSYCTKCGYVDYEDVYSCRDRDGDGLCDDCGASLGGSCGHEHTDITVKSNQNGTHTVTTTCAACGAVIRQETVNCQSVTDPEYVQIGNGTHGVLTYCDECGELIRETTAPCKDQNGDLVCDFCGAAVACPHTNTTTEYSSKGNQMHTVTKICSKCGEVVEQYAENCANANGDGLCDLCGGAMCQHGRVRFSYMSYQDVTHRRYRICDICGKSLGSEVVTCVDGNGDGFCDLCGGSMTCGHTGRSNLVYTDKLNGTHMYTSTCSKCGEELEELQPHADNGNGVCSRCGAAIPTDYESGMLNGVYGYGFEVAEDALVCRDLVKFSGSVAVGKLGGGAPALQTSGKQVLPIPIPKGARSFTYWSPNDHASGISALFFKGVPGAIEEHKLYENASEGRVEYPTWTQSFTPDEWDFVVLNVKTTTSSTILAQRLGTQGILRFSKG